eukprot:COSAG01_NODE_9_length_43729_cov_66.133463_10_plen_200_part_00
MIFKLTGTIFEKNEQRLVVDTASGVGYEVFIASKNLCQLVANESCTLYIYHHIREDQQQLFGFHSLAARQGFITLTSVSGMGPKVASKVLSIYAWEQLQQDILQGNILQLTQLPGIGKRLAERLITELRDKLNSMPHIEDTANASRATQQTNHTAELTLALKSLGYQNREIQLAMQQAKGSLSGDNIGNNLKVMLKHLA